MSEKSHLAHVHAGFVVGADALEVSLCRICAYDLTCKKPRSAVLEHVHAHFSLSYFRPAAETEDVSRALMYTLAADDHGFPFGERGLSLLCLTRVLDILSY